MVWKNGHVYAPADDVLSSVTIEQLCTVAEQLGYVFTAGKVTRQDLLDADLVLAVSVSFPARAIFQVDDDHINVDESLLEKIAVRYKTLPSSGTLFDSL